MVKRKRSSPTAEARLNFRVDEDLRDDLLRLAQGDGRTLSSYMKKVLTDHVRLHRAGYSRPDKKNR